MTWSQICQGSAYGLAGLRDETHLRFEYGRELDGDGVNVTSLKGNIRVSLTGDEVQVWLAAHPGSAHLSRHVFAVAVNLCSPQVHFSPNWLESTIHV